NQPRDGLARPLHQGEHEAHVELVRTLAGAIAGKEAAAELGNREPHLRALEVSLAYAVRVRVQRAARRGRAQLEVRRTDPLTQGRNHPQPDQIEDLLAELGRRVLAEEDRRG